MKLTYEAVERFEGGQAMAMHPRNGYMYLGEIKTIDVDREVPRISFAWVAKSEGFHAAERKWVKADPGEFPVGDAQRSLVPMNSRHENAENPTLPWLLRQEAGNTIILFPPGGWHLDPALVEGLG